MRADLRDHMCGQAKAAHSRTEGTLPAAAALARHLEGALQRPQQLEQKRARRLRRAVRRLRRAASRLRRARPIAPRRGRAQLSGSVGGVSGGVGGGWHDGSGGALGQGGGLRRGGGRSRMSLRC
jgi:hypothetical protein